MIYLIRLPASQIRSNASATSKTPTRSVVVAFHLWTDVDCAKAPTTVERVLFWKPSTTNRCGAPLDTVGTTLDLLASTRFGDLWSIQPKCWVLPVALMPASASIWFVRDHIWDYHSPLWKSLLIKQYGVLHGLSDMLSSVVCSTIVTPKESIVVFWTLQE